MDYLREDVSGLEVEYAKFLERVEEETEDPQWNIENHPARKILERFPPQFKAWVSYLNRIWILKRGGYPFQKGDLSLTEWKAMAILDSHHANQQRLAAMVYQG